MRHDRCGIEDDHDYQPPQGLYFHALHDEGGDQHGRNAADRKSEHDPEVDLPNSDVPDTGARTAQACTGGHDGEAEARVHTHQAEDH
jgi:hypothetical protein